ncbi:protein DOG1-like 4 [Pistacia vera]|uniref:protein DOG1-like 4 n=1 Tax=Pistacia vera TaxID=55513 RepID=UPI001263BF49|nr:protein DOG1-like 4 [Pistacia vera]
MAYQPTGHPNVQVKFQEFLDGWLIRQQDLFDRLILAIKPENIHKSDDQHQTLIDEVLCHYKQYYEEKSITAREDVFLFFSPPWFTSFERTFLWIGGFKPSLVFKILNGSVKDMTDEQQNRMEIVKVETKSEERELTETMAMIQENIAAGPLLISARRAQNMVDGEASSELEAAMRTLRSGMVVALDTADGLRATIVRKVLQILSPIQTVQLSAGAAEFQLRVRRSGLEWDRQRVNSE